jgi:MFS family permease
MQTVAVGALVQGFTGNPVWTVATFVAGFLPNGILAPIGGALADRLDRRRWSIIGTALEGTLALILALLVAGGTRDPVVITLLVLAAGCVAALRMPFQQAMLPDLVPPADVVGAISLGSAQWNLGRVIGPALAGLVIVAGSYSAAFFANAASFLAVIIAFSLIRLPPPVSVDDDRGLVAHLRDGASTVRRTPALRTGMVLIAVAAALVAPFIALVPAFADELTSSKSGLAAATGALTTGQGIGAVTFALAFPSLVERYGRRRMLVLALFATPVALVPYALAPTVAVAACSIVLVGGCYICILSGLSAVMQLRSPAEFRGRVLSLYFATLSVVFPLGALAQGVAARRVGLRWTTLAGAAAMLVAVSALALLRPELLGALDDLPADHDTAEPPIVADAATAEALP